MLMREGNLLAASRIVYRHFGDNFPHFLFYSERRKTPLSLQVWLPLNGNINNYGIANPTILNLNATIDNNGKIGQCYNFAGSGQRIKINPNPIQNSITSFSICAWIYPTTLNTALFGARTSGSGSGLLGILSTSSFYFDDGVRFTCSRDNNDLLNSWHHIAFIKNPTQKLIYIDGILVGSENSTAATADIKNELTIGNDSYEKYSGNDFLGKINDVRIYNHALSEQEIKEIYKSLIVHYPLSAAPSSNLYQKPVRLPVEYQEVQYLESTGTQYINTGLKVIPKLAKATIKFAITDNSVSTVGVFGARNTNGDAGDGTAVNLFWNVNENNKIRYDWYNHQVTTVPIYKLNEIHLISFGNYKTVDNGNIIMTTPITQYSETVLDKEMYIFTFNDAGNPRPNYAHMKLYSCRISADGTKCDRNLIPCYRKSDNKPGMYDLINNQFYTNNGTGEFKCGPLIKNIPNEYMPLNYIESTGTQYLNINHKMTATSERFFITEWTAFVNGNYGFNSSGSKEVIFKINASTNQNYLGGSFNYEWFSNKIYNIYLSTISGALQLMVNDVIIRSSSGTTAEKEEYICAYISSNSANENPDTKTKQRYWHYYIRDNGIPVRDLRPALRISDKKPGMYDLVNDIFYTNAGTGEFLYPSLDTIYDISGFKQNGSITGDLIIAKEGPRYKKYIRYPDSACSIYIGNLSKMVPNGEFTFNIWFRKNTGEWSSKTWETILGGPGGFELESKMAGTQAAYIHPYSWGGGSTSSPNSYSIPYTLDEWHMLTMVRTNSLSKFYLDGEWKLDGTAGTIPSGNYYIGSYANTTAQNYRGYLTDARIYSTALNDNDIQELYNMGRLS